MLTYTNLKTMYLEATGNAGSSDTGLISFFTRSLGTKYQLALAEIADYVTQKTTTDATVVAQQYYSNPIDMVQMENMTVTVGSIAYPLTAISSQFQWSKINETLISTTTIPQFYFPRRDDYGIWPIPQGIYVLTLNYLYRNRNLTVDDVSSTVGITAASKTVTGAGFTASMVNRFIQLEDGYWYRIAAYVSATELTLTRTYQGATNNSYAATIGECPELPDEAHEVLLWGVLSDFYGMYKKDQAAQIWWNNMFYTGDGANGNRTGANIQGGLIGIRNRYAARSNDKIIRKLHINDLKNTYLFTQTISQ